VGGIVPHAILGTDSPAERRAGLDDARSAVTAEQNQKPAIRHEGTAERLAELLTPSANGVAYATAT